MPGGYSTQFEISEITNPENKGSRVFLADSGEIEIHLYKKGNHPIEANWEKVHGIDLENVASQIISALNKVLKEQD